MHLQSLTMDWGLPPFWFSERPQGVRLLRKFPRLKVFTLAVTLDSGTTLDLERSGNDIEQSEPFTRAVHEIRRTVMKQVEFEKLRHPSWQTPTFTFCSERVLWLQLRKHGWHYI